MRKLVAVLAVTFAFAAVVPAASASTYLYKSTAVADALSYQKSQCGDFYHICVNSTFLYPICWGTGVNKSGQAQWDCTGEIAVYYWPGYSSEIWSVNSGWDPYGKRVYGYKYKM